MPISKNLGYELRDIMQPLQDGDNGKDKQTGRGETMVDNDRTVSVAEAAAALGVSTDAIRKRLLRGTIEGQKVAGQWRVTLPDGVGDAAPDAGDPPSGHGLDTGALATAFAQLAAENARNAAAAAMWQERARNLETQVLALQPGDPPENEAVESPRTGDTDATHIGTHVSGDDRASDSQGTRWDRFKRWLSGE